MIDYSERHERNAAYMPNPEQIAREKHRINVENYPQRLSDPDYQTPVDDDCDADLEDAADRECR